MVTLVVEAITVIGDSRSSVDQGFGIQRSGWGSAIKRSYTSRSPAAGVSVRPES